ncbi:MAG: chloride channel protein, partial [Acetobacteraceae bacterium]
VGFASHLFRLATAGHRWVVFLLCPAGLVSIDFLTRKLFQGAQGSGIPQAMAAMHMRDRRMVNAVLSLRILVGKVLLTLVGFACGASIGKEGPTVQVGCSVINAFGRLGGRPSFETKRALILAGGAAGISGAFNTPLAGAIFAIEEMAHSFDVRTSRLLLLAVALGGATTLILAGNYNYFGTVSAALPWGWDWLAVPLAGAGGGLAGGLFAQILARAPLGFPTILRQLATRRPSVFAALCGLALAALGWLSGGGVFDASHGIAQSLLHGHAAAGWAFAPLKWLATLVSYLSGIPGGIFAPSLAAGAGLGVWLSWIFPHAPLGALAMLGMAGYFSGVVQSPITAAVIVMEMTNDLPMTAAVAGAALLGTVFSRLVCPTPVYGALADRFLAAMERGR